MIAIVIDLAAVENKKRGRHVAEALPADYPDHVGRRAVTALHGETGPGSNALNDESLAFFCAKPRISGGIF